MDLMPPEELADLSDNEVFLLAANGDARAQEVMCHRVLSPLRTNAQTLAIAELWAHMATERGHQLSYLTLAQIAAGRGTVHAIQGNEDAAIENIAQAVAMFDQLAAADELYGTVASDIIFAGLKIDGCEEIHAAVLRRAKELQTA